MTTSELIRRAVPPFLWIGWLLLFPASAARPETIRVSVWKIGASTTAEAEDKAFHEGAAFLREAKPDVILLEGVRNRDACLRLIEALGRTNYNLATCSSFNQPRTVETTNIAGLEELKRTYQSRIAKAQADLMSIHRELAERQTALGTLGKDLLAQGAMNWPEVPAERVTEYTDISKEVDKLRAQERELLRRGYKDAHPLVQTVRTLLRSYSTQRAELERNFPTLKYLGSLEDMGTNAPAQEIVGKLTDIRKLSGQAAVSGNALSNLEFEASRIISVETKIAEAERFRLEQQRAGRRATEVAILTRRSASGSNVEHWDGEGPDDNPGGFAYATIKSGTGRVICYSAARADSTKASEALKQLLTRIGSITHEGQEGSAAVIVGFGLGTGGVGDTQADALTLLREAGFIDGLRDLPTAQRTVLESHLARAGLTSLFVQGVTYPFSPQMVSNPGLGLCLLVCDVEVDPTRVAAALRARSELQTAAQHAPVPPPATARRWDPYVLPAGAALVFGLGTLWVWRRGRKAQRRAALQIGAGHEPSQGSAYMVVLAPKSGGQPRDLDYTGAPMGKAVVHVETPIMTQTQSASWQHRALAAEAAAERAQAMAQQGLLRELGAWLKQKVVRKLLADRADLIAGQQAATREVMAVDQRLARIEAQIQHQNRAYVRRIEELTADLHAAKEENRELIRARIAQVKLEMDAAREKLLKAEKEDSTSS